MKVLVTGGAGFIGSHMAHYHLAKNDEVYVIDNFQGGSQKNVAPFLNNERFHFINEDILASQSLVDIIAKVDRIYHFAALLGMFNVIANPVLTLNINIKTTERILQILQHQDKKPLLIVASSSEVYGNQSGLLAEESPLTVLSSLKNHATYPISKLCNESMTYSYVRQYKMPCIIARIFNTIGPRQTGRYGMVVPRFVQQAINNEPITVFGDGSHKRSFCDVRDLVQLLDLLAGDVRCIGQVFNVGNGQFITINALANTVKKLASSTSEIVYLPFEKVYYDDYLEIVERHMDMTKLLSYTNYQYQWQLEDTISDLITQGRKVKDENIF